MTPGATSVVVMYATRFCPFCVQARRLLDQLGIPFQEIRIDGNHDLRREMIEKSGRHTVPQIWFGEDHVGGCDELFALERQGQLQARLSVAMAANSSTNSE